MTKELRVLISGDEIGSIHQNAHGRLTFTYDDDWRQRIDSLPLSLSMPLTQKEHGPRTTENYLWGLISDDPQTREQMAKREGVSPRSAFALMSKYGEDTVGAVQMVAPDRVAELVGRKGIRPIGEKRLAEFLSDLVKHPGHTQIAKDGGKFSLPGAQPKKAICLVVGKWYEPQGRTPSTHIIKPPSVHLDGQVENEYFCARLAKVAGLRVAETEIIDIGGTPNIVVERYDRVRFARGNRLPLSGKGGTVYRVHQEDLCQALSFHPDRKYQRDGGPGMKQIMNFLSGSGDANTDRARFMRACMFNFVVLGIDAHAKNYSVLIEPNGWFRLAPLYDLISALPYDHEEFRLLAMKVGGEGKWRNIGRHQWVKEAAACGYSIDAALEYLMHLIDVLPSAAKSLLGESKKAGLKVDGVLTKFVQELEKRCAKLRAEFAAAKV